MRGTASSTTELQGPATPENTPNGERLPRCVRASFLWEQTLCPYTASAVPCPKGALGFFRLKEEEAILIRELDQRWMDAYRFRVP